ncbi:LysM peptidoglycan-binding domain-containing protein [Desulfocurvus sp.]|jgi:membrane-bound lytic murein transglycosylase D|uniref:LysM peptidoglycan-binding domain-containing protein n=1 Tax=Desulfocurvus sp. TaxID=2871698 RepID=UPI0025BC604D|nr:LysM peptidoglycan-binding domain-containing protein [Desulfocurvus sp.]MCK9239123.1 LysM peptidoglycan-binding domain-containing protein [Desulfocurvus sp.]
MHKSLVRAIAPVLFAVLLLAVLPGCAVKKPVADADLAAPPNDAARQTQPESGALEGSAPDDAELLADGQALEEPDATELTPQEQQALESDPGISFELDERDTDEVRAYFTYYTHKGRKNFEIWLKRSERYLPYVRRVFAERGLPHELVYLPFVESGYNTTVRSRAGAQGMWQFMPFTGKKYGLHVGWWLDERNDPYKATHAAADYLTKLYGDFGDWYLALAAYNAGEGRVAKAIARSGCDDFFELSQMKQNRTRAGRRLYYLPQETRHYVPKLMAVIKIVRNLEALGFEKPDWSGPDAVASVQIPPRTDLRALARQLDMSWDEFKAHNPAFLEAGSHPDKHSTVYLPDEARAAQATAWATGKGFKEFTGYYSFYKVKSGDSWYRISNRVGVPISVLKHYNNVSSNLIRPGQVLKVPGKGAAGLTAERIKKQKGTASSTRKSVRQLAQSRSNYVIQPGDSLWAVAKKYNTTAASLAAANGIGLKTTLKVGQRLYIPDQGTLAAKQTRKSAERAKTSISYKVKSGDTLYSIAKRFGVTTDAILTWNNLSSPRIYPGDSLKLYQ